MISRNLTKVLIDTMAWSLMVPLAYLLRLEGQFVAYMNDIFIVTLLFMPIKLAIVAYNRHQQYSWRFSGLIDSIHILKSIGLFSIVFYGVSLFSSDILFIPQTVPIIEAGLSIAMFACIRVAAQIVLRNGDTWLKRAIRKRILVNSDKRVIIIGAGEAGVKLLKSLGLNDQSQTRLLGFVDDDPSKQGQTIFGLNVLGTIDQLPEIALNYGVSEVIIAIPSASGKQIRRIVDIAKSVKLRFKIIPKYSESSSKENLLNKIREVQIEDLLGRDTVKLDNTSISRVVTHKKVLVTGAGGSIGAEVVRQLVLFNPAEIVLLGRGENSLHRVLLELERDHPHQRFSTRVCNITDTLSLERVFKDVSPDIIFHTAAHKHVRLMEENPSEAVFNNVLGTKNLVRLATTYRVKHFINVSTDKAINPTSVMGACKRLTEIIVQKAAEESKGDAHFVSVRFGNVLGSRGSVVPIFQDQIRRGGPITITDEKMVRYFMTIPEAAQLVLQAAALQLNAKVLVLKMGEPVKIVDLAKDLIQLSGLEVDKDIHIVFTGLQKGEKLFEELSYKNEETTDTSHEDVLISHTNGLPSNADDIIEELQVAAQAYNELEIRRLLKELVPGFTGYEPPKDSALSSLSTPGLTTKLVAVP